MSNSPFVLNQRINNCYAIAGSGGVPPSSNLSVVLANGNDATNQSILNVNDIDVVTINGSAYPPVVAADTLEAVLTAGNEADLNVILKDNLVTPTLTNTISPSSVSITGDGGSSSVGFSVGDVNVSGFATGAISGVVSNASTLSLTNFATSTPPFFQPLNTTINLTSTPTTASLAFTNGGQFTNAKTINLNLDGLTHNSSDGTGDFTITTNGDLLLSSDNLNMSSSTLTIPNSSATIKTTLTGSLFQQTDTATIPSATRLLSIGSNVFQASSTSTQQSVVINGDNGTFQTNRRTSGAGVNVFNAGTGVNPGDNSAAIDYYRGGRNSIAGDIIAINRFNGTDYLGNSTAFSEFQAEVRNNAVGNTDGAIALRGLINGVMTDFFRVNGADGENNCYLPLDMNGQSIKSNSGSLTISTAASTGTGTITIAPKTTASVIIPSSADANDFIRFTPQISANTQQTLMTATDAGTGFVNSINLTNAQYNPFIQLKADFGGGAINKSITMGVNGNGSNPNSISSYDGQTNLPFQIVSNGITNGSIEFVPKDTTGDLIFTGTNIQSATSGSNSGQHLRIKLNGTYYKIRLEDD
nr:MAG: hypothetical protein [Lake Baikal virophage 14]